MTGTGVIFEYKIEEIITEDLLACLDFFGGNGWQYVEDLGPCKINGWNAKRILLMRVKP